MKISDDQKSRVKELISDLDDSEKKYAMECLQAPHVEGNESDNYSDTVDDQIPLELEKMFQSAADEDTEMPSPTAKKLSKKKPKKPAPDLEDPEEMEEAAEDMADALPE
jgi:hypothetical protein